MIKSKMQLTADAIKDILAAGAVMENGTEHVPTEEEKVFGAEDAAFVRRCHVDDQGRVSTKMAVGNGRLKQTGNFKKGKARNRACH